MLGETLLGAVVARTCQAGEIEEDGHFFGCGGLRREEEVHGHCA